MNERKRQDGGIIVAVVLIAVGAWLLLGRVLGDWWSPVRQAFRFAGELMFPLALIAIGVLLLLAARGRLGSIDLHGKRLYRSRNERMLAGVLGGLGNLIGIDPTILRIAYAIFAVASGFGPAVVLYVIAAIFIPEEPVNVPAAPFWPQETGRETVQTPAPPAPPAPAAPEPPSAPQPPA